MEKYMLQDGGKEFGLSFQSSCIVPELIGIINVHQFRKYLFYSTMERGRDMLGAAFQC